MYDAILQLEFQNGVQIVGFADDIALVGVAKHLRQFENQLDAAVSQVREALGDLSLETADHKTEVLMISKGRQMDWGSRSRWATAMSVRPPHPIPGSSHRRPPEFQGPPENGQRESINRGWGPLTNHAHYWGSQE
ncbi:unnamed protein product [Trichogramma brassicae]|uniref:Reverse transcriptase domain-containing protein n=1 Tax=Trichogramma brassicae TaxID=86971 RepID=A0A6H5I9J4_9HYME|nr:unnamed protein product [Trichogramma brassicae]